MDEMKQVRGVGEDCLAEEESKEGKCGEECDENEKMTTHEKRMD